MTFQDRQFVVKVTRNDNLVPIREFFAPQPPKISKRIPPFGFPDKPRLFQALDEFLLLLQRCLGVLISLPDRFPESAGSTHRLQLSC